MKYEIEEEAKKEKFGFIGMNVFAARAHGLKWTKKHPEHIIHVYKKVPKAVRLHTLRHEECEEYFMKNYHYNYQQAHKIALKFEDLEVPFPKKNIKKELMKLRIITGNMPKPEKEKNKSAVKRK